MLFHLRLVIVRKISLLKIKVSIFFQLRVSKYGTLQGNIQVRGLYTKIAQDACHNTLVTTVAACYEYKALNANRGRLKMVEVFIAWNQNYNKFIDFINYHIKRTTNSELIIHAFVARNIAEKDCPRDLEYVLKHDCLTNTADSAEAHLIAYIMRCYISKEKTTASGGKLLLLAQTRPGQHEELLMLLSGMPEFTSRNIARIYRIDDEFQRQVTDDLMSRQHEFGEESRLYSQNVIDNRKSHHCQENCLGLESNHEMREVRNHGKAIYPEFHRDYGYKQRANHVPKYTNPNSIGTNGTGQEPYNFILGWPVYAKNGKRTELSKCNTKPVEREMQSGTKQNAVVNEFITNYERHDLCKECLKGSSNADIIQTPSARRTWPSTQSGRRKREERTKICGLCMERFHCIQPMDDTNTKLGSQDSFESTFDDIGNRDRKFETNRIVLGNGHYNITPLEQQIMSRPNYTL